MQRFHVLNGLLASVCLGVLGTAAPALAVASPATITGSGFTNGVNAGFGDRIGANSTLAVSTDGTGNITFTLDPAGTGNGLDNRNAVVIYFDTTGGTSGFSGTGGLTSISSGGNPDEIREAVSGFNGTDRSTLNFAPGFKATYALGFENGFGSLYQLSDAANFGFVASANPSGTADPTFTVTTTFANLGLTNTGSFRYIATYLDSVGSYRSNEYQGVSAATGAGLTNGRQDVTLGAGDFNTFRALAPEPGTLSLVVLGGLLTTRRRSR